MSIVIDLSKCNICGECVNACPSSAIQRKGGVVVIDESLCTLCKRCFDVCPLEAISEETVLENEQEFLSLAPQKIEVIEAEPIPVQERPIRPVLIEFAKGIIPRLLVGVIYLMNRKSKSAGIKPTNFGNNREPSKGARNRHRHRQQGSNKMNREQFINIFIHEGNKKE
jgi:ferredoxin